MAGDGTRLEGVRGIKALGGSIPPPSALDLGGLAERFMAAVLKTAGR